MTKNERGITACVVTLIIFYFGSAFLFALCGQSLKLGFVVISILYAGFGIVGYSLIVGIAWVDDGKLHLNPWKKK